MKRNARRRGALVSGAVALGLLTFCGAVAGPVAAALPDRVEVFRGLTGRPAAGPGTNLLLLGTDSREGVTAAEKDAYHAGGAACGCTDVMMLVHIARDHDRISVVSLPRDSYADVPRTSGAGTHPAKLNAAYRAGGAAGTVRTVEAMTGLRVDHVLQLDFRRFMDAVQQTGGVDVCPARPFDDPGTGLVLAPGRHRLGGGPALQYVRSRHIDAAADLGRIQRQQRFVVTALRGRGLRGVLADPARALRLASTVLGQGARTDEDLGPAELVSLTRKLAQVPSSRVEFGVVPIDSYDHRVEGVGSTLHWDARGAAAMFGKLRRDEALLAADARPRPLDPPSLTEHPTVRGDTLECD
jgi:LCP family protein required for cell wall assembly